MSHIIMIIRESGCIQFQVDYINNFLSKINFLPIDMDDGLADIMNENVAA